MFSEFIPAQTIARLAPQYIAVDDDLDLESAHDGQGARAVLSPQLSEAAQELLRGLNEQQEQAVTSDAEQLLIIAGAGSGKTRVLTHRIAYQIATGEVEPYQVLAITFTNKAAAEMRERLAELLPGENRGMWISTFHSACLMILRQQAKVLGLKSSFSIYDTADSLRVVNLVARDLGLDSKQLSNKAILRSISNLKNELIDPDAALQQALAEDDETSDADRDRRVTVAEVYQQYQQRLRSAHALDFDDLIMSTVELLQAFPQVKAQYRHRFRHVLVDEYQDTNHAQYVLVRELVGHGEESGAELANLPSTRLTVVGDADQSIYAFRGATIRNIAEFEADYPQAETIVLEQNYRSTQNILSAANAVIAKNHAAQSVGAAGSRGATGEAKSQKSKAVAAGRSKRLWTALGSGAPIEVFSGEDEYDEARFVVDQIAKLVQAGDYTYGDIAVFYRTNAQSRALEEALIRQQIAYRLIGGVKFYERKEIKDALAYLQILVNPDDDVNFRRIFNEPKRSLGQRTEELVATHAAREAISFGAALDQAADIDGLSARAKNVIADLVQTLAEIREFSQSHPPHEVLAEVLDRSGYLQVLRNSKDIQDQTRVENLAELHAVAADFHQLEPETTLADFLARVGLVADADQLIEADDQGQVTLMTIHTAKGLEFPAVFITGLEDGTFPHARSFNSAHELSEERRLAYVAITRARERLFLSCAASRSMWGMPEYFGPSRFIDEIPADLLTWKQQRGNGAGLRGGLGTQRRVSHGVGVKRKATQSSAGGAKFGSATPLADSAIPVLAIGDKITHDAYGLGTVVELEGSGANTVAKVTFRDDTRRLLLRFSPITKL